MSARDAWSQDVVLKAMCECIEKLRKEGTVRNASSCWTK